VWDISAFLFIPFSKNINSTGIIYTLLGALFMGVGSLAYFYALRNGPAGSTTVLTSMYPAVTLILASVFLKESFSFKQGIGIALALIAFVLVGSK
jgi:transporter family protein